MIETNILQYQRLYIEISEAKTLLGQRLFVVDSHLSNNCIFEGVEGFRGREHL